jgi:glutathione S-transferase
MQLIGMLDSPYVRRVAISLRLLGLPFEHRPISVFRQFDAFRAINPVVKAPSLVCDDGEVLMDSTLILQYAEAIAAPRSLMPRAPEECRHALRFVGLALAACEKTVQIVYEHQLRPPEKRHDPWLERVHGQLASAYAALEGAIARRPLEEDEARLDQAGITSAVAWSFTQAYLPGVVDPAAHPGLAGFADRMERLPVFVAWPGR